MHLRQTSKDMADMMDGDANESAAVSASESSQSDLGLVQAYPPSRPFTSVKKLLAAIDETPLHKNNYLSFTNVTPQKYTQIDRYRERKGDHLRLTYFPDSSTLIVKVLVGENETAHRSIFMQIGFRLMDMEVRMREFMPHVAATVQALTPAGDLLSSKEADSSGINKALRTSRWPGLIIESGSSECLPYLLADAQWWIKHSAGQVGIVILVKVDSDKRHVEILKCHSRPCETTSTESSQIPPRMVSQVITQITIDQSVSPSQITGAPLVVEFDRAVGRAPIPPKESDVAISAQELDEIVSGIWYSREE